VCTELCSLHLQLDDRVENLVASALFADGSGAMVIGRAALANERPRFELHHSASHIIPNTLPMMSWDVSKTGMIIGLDKHIPGEIFTHIPIGVLIRTLCCPASYNMSGGISRFSGLEKGKMILLRRSS